MNGLDEKDVAILKALQENADVTNKELAAKVHLSPTPVFERVKRLREQGYIKKVAAVLDADKLDCSFMAFCSLLSFCVHVSIPPRACASRGGMFSIKTRTELLPASFC